MPYTPPPSESDETNEEVVIEPNGKGLTEKRKRQAEGRRAAEKMWNEIKANLQRTWQR